MKKLTKKQIETINKNMIISETEKALKIKVNFVSLTGFEKNINIWTPKSCVEKTECGFLKIKDWFIKSKERELHGYIQQVAIY